MKKLICILLSLTLTACTPFWCKKDDDQQSEDRTKPKIDADLLVKCHDEFSPLKPNPKPSDILAQHGADAQQYNDCKNRHNGLVDVVNRMVVQ